MCAYKDSARQDFSGETYLLQSFLFANTRSANDTLDLSPPNIVLQFGDFDIKWVQFLIDLV